MTISTDDIIKRAQEHDDTLAKAEAIILAALQAAEQAVQQNPGYSAVRQVVRLSRELVRLGQQRAQARWAMRPTVKKSRPRRVRVAVVATAKDSSP